MKTLKTFYTHFTISLSRGKSLKEAWGTAVYLTKLA
jgi:hypothetical protein